jgi:uncharacterized membrane protein YfcA
VFVGGINSIGLGEALVSALMCVPAFAGLFVGERLQTYCAQETFRKLVLVLIFAGAADMVRRGVV